MKLGHVSGTTDRGVLLQLAQAMSDIAEPVKAGDGVVFDEGHPDLTEVGGRVWHVKDRGRGTFELIFAANFDPARVAANAVVWKTDDPALRKRLQSTFSHDVVVHHATVHFTLSGFVGGPLELKASDELGHSVTATWEGPLQQAQKHPLNLETLTAQLGRLGDSPFTLGQIHFDPDQQLMVPKSVLNALRRETLEKLQTARLAVVRYPAVHPHALGDLRLECLELSTPTQPPAENLVPQLYVMARNLDQLQAVLDWQPPSGLQRPAMVYCDFEDPRRYLEAAGLAEAGNLPLAAATMRIAKPGEEGFLARLAESGVQAALVRNLAGICYLREKAPHLQLIGDFSLNVANELTAALFREQGLQRLTPSYDLNWDQLAAMLERVDPSWCELVIHQHIPMFHMEHCVFAAFLSTGKDYRDCGRPCDDHRVELRDRVGAHFPVLADAGCRNTVFNSLPQSAAEYVPRMKALGVRHFRVELLRETPNEIGPLLNRYSRVINGLDTGREAWRGLQVLQQLGVTRGTLAVT